ncbi:hypothetical protein GQ85_21450 [Rhodococcus rhodochrous]|nr:hypothetical protein GQ85_21450 [Rhodococcus rhodochrous]
MATNSAEYARRIADRTATSTYWNTIHGLVRNVANALIDYGYRRTWTISTAAEVEALPEGTVVLVQGIAWQSERDGWLTAGITRHMRPHELIEAAAGHYAVDPVAITVIHTPED